MSNFSAVYVATTSYIGRDDDAQFVLHQYA
jgi:hypothetical protein